MQHYLFVHFREKSSPDGEQVYFALSRDGFTWESVNNGRPVLWAFYGDKGVRDFTIARLPDGNGGEKFFIVATDLSLAYGMRNQYKHSWAEIGRNGSKNFSVWESTNLVDWSEQRLAKVGTDDFGCLWAPDVIFDPGQKDYILHWSSSHAANNYGNKKIYYSRTKDFTAFTKPEILYQKDDSGIIDSAMYREGSYYYLFVKSEANPSRIILLKSAGITGPWQRVEQFDKSMSVLQEGLYEAPTAVRLDNGKWALFLDYYGAKGQGQGYIPFIADSLQSGDFKRSDAQFSFPYGFKHGTILSITEEEYQRIKSKPSWEIYW